MSPTIAIVHEWISARAGSEKVFERLAAVFPDADLYALTSDPDVPLETGGRPVRTTWLDRPSLRDRRAVTLPVMPLAWHRLSKGTSYDVVISSTHAFGREFVDPARHGTHHCYVHAPMRYAWDRGLDPRTSSPFAAPVSAALRRLDERSVRHVTSFAANSTETRDRVRRHYRREASVIHPPVDVSFFADVERQPRGYLLAYGRFIEYKRFDLAIEVAHSLGRRLVIAGDGPLGPTLLAHAEQVGAAVEFRSRPSDGELRTLLGGADALLFPGVEDFGIIPVEAQAAGVPVVGPRLGGLLDTVRDGVTGVLAAAQTVESLAAAVAEVDSKALGGDPCRTWAVEQFATRRFDDRVRAWVLGAGAGVLAS